MTLRRLDQATGQVVRAALERLTEPLGGALVSRLSPLRTQG
jgi:hypothetical protein